MSTGLGRGEEALRYLRTGLREDPINYGLADSLQGTLLYMGRFREALEQGRRVLEMQPNDTWGTFFLGETALALGDHKTALESFERLGRLDAGFGHARLAGLAAVHFAMGHQPESDRFMRQLEREAVGEDAYLVAKAHAYRHELDAAFRWLARARDQKDMMVAMGPGDPAFAPYVDEPRYRAWLAGLYPPNPSIGRPGDSSGNRVTQ